MGITIEEEQAQIAAQKEAERKAAEEKAAKEAAKAAKESKKTETTQGEAVSAGADDLTLLAAIIECEAGGESYECQLAVGAAVINRVKSGSYPNSISGVIYQKGQFDRHHQESSQESLADAFLLHATVQHRRQCPEWTTQEDVHPSMTMAQEYQSEI